MSVSRSDVYATFPEFDLTEDSVANETQDALVDAKLAEAEGMVDRTIFAREVNADSAVKYLTAHLIAMSPAGINMKLIKAQDDSTIYFKTYRRLIGAAAGGFRVI